VHRALVQFAEFRNSLMHFHPGARSAEDSDRPSLAETLRRIDAVGKLFRGLEADQVGG